MSLDQPSQVNAVCMDLLLQEMIPTSIRVSESLAQPESTKDIQTDISTPLSRSKGDLPGTLVIFENEEVVNSDEVTLRTENLGFNLGIRLTEVLMYKLAGTPNKVVDILDIMKFVCRDIWKCLYGKQMDNLRTNHRGTFVLIDNDYRLIRNLSSPKGTPSTIAKARSYLWFHCGVIRGILSSFGIDASITAEISQFPSVVFSIHTAINN